MLIDEETYYPGKTTLRPLKASEPMRIGAALRPQCFGEPFDKHGGSCALGAWWEGMGHKPIYERWWHIIGDAFQRMTNINSYQIVARNDGYIESARCWTRESIADWLEAQGQ